MVDPKVPVDIKKSITDVANKKPGEKIEPELEDVKTLVNPLKGTNKTWARGKDIKGVEKQFKDLYGFDLKSIGYSDSDEYENLAEQMGVHLGVTIDRHPNLGKLLKRETAGDFNLVNSPTVEYVDGRVRGSDERSGTGGHYGSGQKFLSIGTKYGDLGKGKLEIGIDNFVVDASVKGTLRHEIGHRVWDIDKTLATKWNKAFEKAGVDPFTDPDTFDLSIKTKEWIKENVSEYANTNIEETFAESFAAYTHKDYLKKADRLPTFIEAFFDETIGRK